MLTRRALSRRFVVLRMTRWFPTGLVIPIYVLFLLDRGFSLSEIAVASAAQGAVVLALELPTGGLADAVGRRRVLLIATVIDALFLAALIATFSLWALVAAFALQGVYRALESGPLDAWYVDRARAIEPDAPIDRGLAHGMAAIGVAIAAGAALSGALVAFGPDVGESAVILPLIIAVVLRIGDAAMIAALMSEPEPESAPYGSDRRGAGLGLLGDVGAIIADAIGQIRASRALAALVGVEFLWGFGLGAYEALPPARLGELEGGTERAATLFGPTVTVAWLVMAAFATFVPRISDRLGRAPTAMVLHAALGLVVVAMAATRASPVVIASYVVAFGLHGAINPVYQTLLHEFAQGQRATVVSVASMAAHSGAAIGGIVLGRIADLVSIPTAMVVGAAVVAAAALFYAPSLGRSSAPAPTG